jgi:microcystin-dependent protein
MASTYTSNIRLTKQGDGDNPNTWGQVLNDGVISLVDEAIAGYTAVSIGSTASVTLTNNQGSGDQARSAILELTGSIGGTHTSIFVLIPNNSKSYVIRNSVSNNNSSDAIIVRVAGNAGVTIPPSSNTFVITNGTSVYNVTPATFGSAITVEGAATFESTMTVSGNATFASNVNIGGTVTITGANVQAVNAKVCASAFYGDGSNLSGLLPPGVIFPYGVTAAPTGYKVCDGSAHTRTGTSTSALFTIIGTLYGAGNGSTTFNVPDLAGKFMAGIGSGLTSVTTGMIVGTTIGNTGGVQNVTLATAQMPSHTHDAGNIHFINGGDAAQAGSTAVHRSSANGVSVMMSGSTSATGGGGTHSNIPPTLIVQYIIKL